MYQKGRFTFHFCKDVSALTPYEQKIFELKQQGKNWADIAKEIGNKNPKTIAVRYSVIKEKLESMEWEKQG